MILYIQYNELIQINTYGGEKYGQGYENARLSQYVEGK